jgi:hypothetical protein
MKPVENGGRSTVTVRDGGWYGKEVEDGDLWPWVWSGEEDEGWNGLTLVDFLGLLQVVKKRTCVKRPRLLWRMRVYEGKVAS